jgi:nucleoside-diphosphate-sugar epimerase
MRVLLTGVSSFTGGWFATALAESGCEVIATSRRPPESYAGVAARRLELARCAGCVIRSGLSFGDPAFVDLIAANRVDVLCHHGVEIGDFRSAAFDPIGCHDAATANADGVMAALARSGGRALVVTGSVFEGAAAAGQGPVLAYGLAKARIRETLSAAAARHGLATTCFVVPHPIGALEKPGLGTYLAGRWLAGEPARLRHPWLVRDFIHVELLAALYAAHCRAQLHASAPSLRAPSGHVASLLEHARWIAAALRPRLGVPCEIAAGEQHGPSDEPEILINPEPTDALAATWPIDRAWDRLADFYLWLNSSTG